MQGGSRVIGVLEAAWGDIQAAHPEVPNIVMITGTAARGRGEMLTLGHFDASAWKTADGRLPELFVAGELLAADGDVSAGRRAMKTLLHEAAHGLAAVRGITECSRGGRYHNRRFVELAAELGLTEPGSPHSSIGWSMVTLEDDGAARWASTIARIDAAALPYLDRVQIGSSTSGGDGKGGGRQGARRSAVCKCEEPRRLSVTPKQLDVGPLICGLCLTRHLGEGMDLDAARDAARFTVDDGQADEDD